ncbi:hypothetical protein CHS0354_040117 [Potamilus streckersoni]|uniref:Fibrinogen C-terminal domain-containing protein n=1 Tax=Potamilus streckersoni TaxID=2493646 RepID=A0AAE0W1W5_9BIVA|nr:hypothetical protein CHS0354_040117 [Potamilus streckersoni]
MALKINVLNVICLFIGSYVVGSKDLCDVRIWYQNLIADDIFIRDLDRDQIKLRNNIESLVLKSSETETARMIDCYIIEMYNEMLQEKYDYAYNRKIRGDTKQPEEQMPTGKGTDKNLVLNESSNNAKAETSATGQISAEKGADVRERVNEKIHDITTDKEAHQKADEYDKLGSVSEIDETEFSEDETVFSKEDENYMLDVENEAKNLAVNLSEHTIKEPLVSNNQKKTSQVLIIEGASENLNITAPGEPSEPKADTMLNGVKTEKRSMNSMPFGVCRKLYCTWIDIFDALCCENSTGESNISSQKKQYNRLLSLSYCHNGLVCSNHCFYVFSPTYCIVGYLSWIQKYDADTERGQQLDVAKPSDQGPVPPDSIDGKLESSIEGTQIYEQEEDKEKVSKSVPETRDEDKPKMLDVQTDINTDELNIQKEMHPSNSKDRLSLEEIELHMNKKTSEYGSKLQNLELMILRLENQLLLEKMNKQNHSSTITKLENQILKLENILLNMNKKYSDLLSESQGMRARQIKYLELEQERKNDKYLALEDKSAQNLEMITQHQAKIIELTEKLENQTEIISILKGRSEYIENHNRMLYQLIMNQTVFMSQIMQRIQDLSDQNSKQREETSILKQKLDMSLARNKLLEFKQKLSTSVMSERFMEQLYMLVSDTNIPNFDKKIAAQHEPQGNVKNDDDDADIHFKDYLNKGSFHEQIINWCPSENYSAPACMSNVLFSTQCPPYNNLIWRICNGKVTQQNTSKTSDSVLDNGEGKIVNRENITTDGIDKDLQVRPKEVSEGDTNVSGRRKEDNILYKNSEMIDTTKADDEQKMQKPVDSKDESMDEITIKDDGEETKLSTNFENQLKIDNDKSFKDEYKYVGSQEHIQHVERQEHVDENYKILKVLEQQGYVDRSAKRSDVLEQQEPVDKNAKRSDVPEQEPVDRNAKRTLALEQQEPIDKNAKQPDVLEQEPVERNAKRSDVLDQQESVDRNAKRSDVLDQQEPVDRNAKRSNVLDQQEPVDRNAKQSDVLDQQEPVDGNAKRSGVLEQTNEDAHKNDDNTSTQQKEQEQEQDSLKGTQVPKGGTVTKAEAKKERKTPIYMTDEKQREPKDCYDYYVRGNYKDGTYKIKPTGSAELIQVFCDMKRGGWTMIQKRQDGSTNFFRKWEDYKKGFGGLYGEHWIGNENIHRLTNQDYYSLRVDLRDWDKEWRYAIYEFFLVDSEDMGYRLNIDGYSGDAGDGLGKHDGSKFSTTDVDNDKVVKEFGGSCANRFHGAGWYYKCYSSNMNGKYYTSGTIPEKLYDGVTWKPWKGPNYSLRVTEMKIRPSSVKDGK